MSEKKPEISVLIPTYNRAHYLTESLNSILNQTLPPCQIIVVNDGSTDNTRQVVNTYNKQVDYIERKNNEGKASAVNVGLEEVSGDYLWIFDDDDIALPNALERFIEPLEINPRYNFSYSNHFISREQTCQIVRKSEIPDVDRRGLLIPLLEACYLGGPQIFARASVYKEAGHFNPKLLRSEDYEMAIRIIRSFKGARLKGGPTFIYREHGGLRSDGKNLFPAKYNKKNWLKYDQIIFRSLYQELPLTDYLPPGRNIDNHLRQALIQRLYIMSSKLLLSEVIKDLEKLASVNDRSPFSRRERKIIKNLVVRIPFYNQGRILDHQDFPDMVNKLATSSPVINLLKKEIIKNTSG